MNCKKGEQAFILRDPSKPGFPRVAGSIVTCVHLAPSGDFRLPDGYPSSPTKRSSPAWVVEFQCFITMPCDDGKTRQTRYAVVLDCHLRPIRPGDISDSEVEELYRAPSLPVKEQA